MGLTSYYHWFVKRFVVISFHISHLTLKEAPFEWDDKCEERFQKLNTMLTLGLLLTLTIEGKDFFCI